MPTPETAEGTAKPAPAQAKASEPALPPRAQKAVLPAVAPAAPGATAPQTSKPGQAIVAKLLEVAGNAPHDLPRLLHDEAFVRWAVTPAGIVALDHMESLTNPSPGGKDVARVDETNGGLAGPAIALEDGYRALTAICAHLPASPLLTEVKLLLAIRGVLKGGITHPDFKDSWALLKGVWHERFPDEKHKADARTVAADLWLAAKNQPWLAVLGDVIPLVGDAPSLPYIDDLLKNASRKLLAPYRMPLANLASVLPDPQIQALIGVGLSMKLPFDRALLYDLKSGAFSPKAVTNCINKEMSDDELAGLLQYMVKHVPGKVVLPLNPPAVAAEAQRQLVADVRTLLHSATSFQDIQLENFVDSIELGGTPAVKVVYKQDFKDLFETAPRAVTLGEPEPPPDKNHPGKAMVHDLRVAMDTVAPAFASLLADERVILKLAADKNLILGPLQLIDGESHSDPELLRAFAHLETVGNLLPDSSLVKPLMGLVPAMIKVFGLEGAREAVQPLLMPSQSAFESFYAALQNKRSEAEVTVTKSLGLSLPDVLKDVLNKRIFPDIVAGLADGSLSAAHIYGVLDYLLSKKNPLTLPVTTTAQVLLRAYPKFANAPFDVIDSITFSKTGPGPFAKVGRLSFEYSKEMTQMFAPLGPAPVGDGTSGTAVVTNLRQGLAALPIALSSLVNDPAVVAWLAEDALRAAQNPQSGPPVIQRVLLLRTVQPGTPGYEQNMRAGFSALAEFAQHLPPTAKKLKSLLTMIPAMIELFGYANAQAAVEPLLTGNAKSFGAIAQALSNIHLAETVSVSRKLGLSIPSMLEDIRKGAFGKIDLPGLVAKVADGALQTADLHDLLAYLVAKKSPVTINLQDANVQALLGCYKSLPTGADLSLVQSMTLSSGGAGGAKLVGVELTPAAKQALSPVKINEQAFGQRPGAPGPLQKVFDLRRAIASMPPGFRPLLGSTAFIDALTKDPSMLTRMMALASETPLDAKTLDDALNAVAEFTQALPPDEKILRPMLALVPLTVALFGKAGVQQAMAGILRPNKEALQMMASVMAGVMTNPNIKATMAMIEQTKLPIATVLDDIVSQRLPSDLLARMLDGKPTAADMAKMIEYMLSFAKPGDALTTSGQPLLALLGSFRHPEQVQLKAIKSLTLAKDGRVSIAFSDDPKLLRTAVSLGPIGLKMAELTGQLKTEANSLTIKADFGTYTAMLFNAEFDTGLSALDAFLNILLILAKLATAPLLFVFGLIGDAYGIEVKLSDEKDGTHLRMQALGKTLEAISSR